MRPLWAALGWTEEGAVAYGRVVKYQERPKPAGWIDVDDGGPEVYFHPGALAAELTEMLRKGRLVWTRVMAAIQYCPNGKERKSRDVRLLEEGVRPRTSGARLGGRGRLAGGALEDNLRSAAGTVGADAAVDSEGCCGAAHRGAVCPRA